MFKTTTKHVRFKEDVDDLSIGDNVDKPDVPKKSSFAFLKRPLKAAPNVSPAEMSPAPTPEKPKKAENLQEAILDKFDKLNLDSPENGRPEKTSDPIATVQSSSYGGPRPNYADFLNNDNSYFCLEPIEGAPKPLVKRPLSVTYDEELKQWLVADTFNHRVLSVPSNTVFRGLRKPGAVSVYEPGVSFIVVDENGIYMFNHGDDKPRVIASLNHPARGVAVTPQGNIITMQQRSHDKHSQNIVVYKANSYDEVIYYRAYSAGTAPSFIHFHEGELTVTDLSSQVVSIYGVKEEKGDIVEITLVKEIRAPHKSGDTVESGSFLFVSGVHQDNSGLRIVADASQHCLFLYDRNGPVQRISCKEALPYTSGLWINMSGEVALCDRQGNSVGFYRLVGIPEKLAHVEGVQRAPYQASTLNNQRAERNHEK